MRNIHFAFHLSICLFTFQFAQSQKASISSLNCSGATNNGTLRQGVASSGVTSVIPYTGGNGGSYIAQSVNSTGVMGLIATLPAGNIAGSNFNLLGTGSLTYAITGTPASSGTASFALSIGGKSCTLIRTVVISQATASCSTTNVLNAALLYGSMTDQDGNVYKTIQVGNQTWMAENLRARRYRNGEVIPLVTNNATWSNLFMGATCWYNNDSAAYNCPYGKLYNWYAVADSREVCPTGWHVPTFAEVETLRSTLGGFLIAKGKMKSSGFQYWLSPNTAADNLSGWSGLPGGKRKDGSFESIRNFGYWWSSTENSASEGREGKMHYLTYDDSAQFANSEKKATGLSVRCVKD
jgi:uncharacterized protein (TIGR02145 family)